MGTSPESVVADFLAAWGTPTADRLAGFFSENALYIDGPGNEHRGADAIRQEFEKQLLLGGQGVSIEVKHRAVVGHVVMVERVDRFTLAGQTFELEAVGVYEVGDDGQIALFRDYYDQAAIKGNWRPRDFKCQPGIKPGGRAQAPNGPPDPSTSTGAFCSLRRSATRFARSLTALP